MSKKTIKVLHISTAITWGGGEQQITYLLKSDHRTNHKFWLMAPKQSPLYHKFLGTNIEIIGFKKTASLDLFLAIRISAWIKSADIDIVHAHDSHAHSNAYFSKRLFKWSSRLIVHRRVVYRPSSSILSKWKYTSEKIDRFIAVSNATAKTLTEYGIQKDRVTLIYSGVESELSFDSKSNLRKKLELPTDKVVIGNIGNLTKPKDHITFIRTAKELIKHYKHLHFVIIGGDAGEEGNIRRFLHQFGLNDCVTLTGFVEKATQFLPAFDLFLFTSLEEGLGTSVIDAMAAGIPVVSTRAGGIPEVIQHGHSGLLADLKSVEQLVAHCTKILNNESFSQHLATQGKIRANAFRVSIMRDKTHDLYAQLLGNTQDG